MRAPLGKKGHGAHVTASRSRRRRILFCVFFVVVGLCIIATVHQLMGLTHAKAQVERPFAPLPTTTTTTTTFTTSITRTTTGTSTRTTSTAAPSTTTATAEPLPPSTEEKKEEDETVSAVPTTTTEVAGTLSTSTSADAGSVSDSASSLPAPSILSSAAPNESKLLPTVTQPADPAGEAVVPAMPIRYPALPRKTDEGAEENVWFDRYTSVLHVRVPAAANASATSATEGAAEVEMLFPLIHVRDRSKRTVEAEEAYAAGEAVATAPPAAAELDCPLHTNEITEAFVLPLTELDAAVKEDAQTLQSSLKTNMGSPHKRWQQKLPVNDVFEIPSWASAGEQNALRHGSIFVSLAAYRDRECAASAYDILKQSASPHRIYFGISDEREQSDKNDDLSCLAGIMHPDYTPVDSLSVKQWQAWREHQKRSTTTAPLEVKEEEEERTTESYRLLLERLNKATTSLRPEQEPHVRRMLYGAAAPQAAAMPLFSATFTWESLLQQHNDFYKEAQQRYSTKAAPARLLHNVTIMQTGDLLTRPTVKARRSTYVLTPEEKATNRTRQVPRRTIFLDDHYPTDTILCIGGAAERQRDLFLLHEDLRVRYAADRNTTTPPRTPYPHLRRGRGGAQEAALQPLAGCRVVARTAERRAARGPTYGRYITSLFYFNQDFYMMIDSHSRFAPQFDLKFIVNLFQVARHGVLSHYPNGYTPMKPTEEFGKVDMMSMCTAQVLSNGMPKLGARWRPFQAAPIPEAFAAAGFLFGDAQYALDVPFDPLLPYLFDGEEIMYSARLWTSGWDILCPSGGFVFHYYGRDAAHRDWASNLNARELRHASELRVLYLLQRYQPWAQTLEAYNALVQKAKEKGESVPPPPAYEAPALRRIVPESATVHNPYLATYKSYLGLGTQRGLDDYWEFTGLTDKHINKRDNENRWMGGEELCSRKVETEDE